MSMEGPYKDGKRSVWVSVRAHKGFFKMPWVNLRKFQVEVSLYFFKLSTIRLFE